MSQILLKLCLQEQFDVVLMCEIIGQNLRRSIFERFHLFMNCCSSSSSGFYFSVGDDTILFMFDIYNVFNFNIVQMYKNCPCRGGGAKNGKILSTYLVIECRLRKNQLVLELKTVDIINQFLFSTYTYCNCKSPSRFSHSLFHLPNIQ